MRPLRLDMAGFTVFREETTVDFSDADFFALVGPTGSGKSTVLDAICFALYGQVPRWASSRGIVNALAPSATEARVRLVFESAGARYVATRVVRRDGKGRVSTGGAGLQLMPRGFDPAKLDSGLTPEDLGEVRAGTPAEMDAAVLEAVGLPYEQFTSCVVLPQGQFADFLHAKPAARQEILVNLLGLHVYEAIQKKASARAMQADAQLVAVDQLLDDLSDADDESLEAAAGTLQRALHTLDALGDPPYNLFLHTSPAGERLDATFHWHWELHPRLRVIAGLERATALAVNPAAPEYAAQVLRSALRP